MCKFEDGTGMTDFFEEDEPLENVIRAFMNGPRRYTGMNPQGMEEAVATIMSDPLIITNERITNMREWMRIVGESLREMAQAIRILEERFNELERRFYTGEEN